MGYSNMPLTTLHYSRNDDSWYGWWSDGEPATISTTHMQEAYLELFHSYKQQGLSAAAAGRQAYAEVHSMTYWNACAAAARRMPDTWARWDRVGLAMALGLLALQFLH